MKNFIKSAIFAFVLSAAAILTANASDKEVKKTTGFDSGVYASKDGKIKINIDKYNHATTAILLQDSKGKVVYQEVAGKSDTKLRREIDVNQLGSGNYTLEITSKGEKQTKILQVTDITVERVVKLNK
jgi:hypothetical protein